tara:strand:- start:14198 stop:15166 length:969 start_codon:yes stop_codon:yes gene_type:complete
MLKKILILTILFQNFVLSQNNFDNFLNDVVQQSIHDSEIMLEGYMSPFGSAIGFGLNGGWYNTAKPHNVGGFDITAGLHIISIPNSAQSYNPENDFEIFEIKGEKNIPTFMGDKNSNSQIVVNGQPIFDAPGGVNVPYVPIPYFQGSIGGPKKTDILFRLSPFKLDFGKMEIGYWGIGFKHDLLQWIPIADKIPIDLSYLISYSKLSSSFNFDGNRSLDFKVRGLNQYLALSKKLSFITLYSGIGYHFSNSRLELLGNYNTQDQVDQDLIDPLDFSFGNINGFKADLGIRMKILIFNIHANYTRAEYDIFTVGLSLTTEGLY